jgi:hypothetical protein
METYIYDDHPVMLCSYVLNTYLLHRQNSLIIYTITLVARFNYLAVSSLMRYFHLFLIFHERRKVTVQYYKSIAKDKIFFMNTIK